MQSELTESAKKVLIVEDEVALTDIFKTALTKEGFAVTVALSGDKGLAIALSEHPDAILLDIMLPGMDGLTVLSNLRKDLWGKTVPVVILTNLTPDDRIIDSIARDVPSFYMVKVNSSTEAITEKLRAAMSITAASA
jgi:DNA-binding response OmpR family regulator